MNFYAPCCRIIVEILRHAVYAHNTLEPTSSSSFGRILRDDERGRLQILACVFPQSHMQLSPISVAFLKAIDPEFLQSPHLSHHCLKTYRTAGPQKFHVAIG